MMEVSWLFVRTEQQQDRLRSILSEYSYTFTVPNSITCRQTRKKQGLGVSAVRC